MIKSRMGLKMIFDYLPTFAGLNNDNPMLNVRFYLVAPAAYLVFGTFFACQSSQNADYLQKADALAARSQMYHRQLCQLQHSTDSLWDAVTAEIEKGLTPDIPPTDRQVFLTARATEHMTMFMSFKKLDPKIQEMVIMAGKIDAVYANQIRALQQDMSTFEHDKNMLLTEAERAKANAKEIAERIGPAPTSPCE